MTETTLYFGLSGPQGPVGDAAWEKFRGDVLIPAFSEGFIVVDGHGYWKNPENGRSSSELSKVVIRVHERRAGDEEAIGHVIDAYISEFQQQSVLRVDTPVCAAF